MNEFAHQVFDHAEAYVDGNIHTNGADRFSAVISQVVGKRVTYEKLIGKGEDTES